MKITIEIQDWKHKLTTKEKVIKTIKLFLKDFKDIPDSALNYYINNNVKHFIGDYKESGIEINIGLKEEE